MKKTAKITLLVLIGIFMGLIVAEIGLRLKNGAPKQQPYDEDFYWEFVDIYTPFYKKDKEHGFYVSQRKRSKKSKFAVKKPFNEKRVFIIGESFALQYEKDILQDKLTKILPAYNWNVINCGMAGYDSYRILLIAKELPKYDPDLVVLLMGNNTGSHNPIEISYLKYKYPLIGKTWVTSILSNYIERERKVNKKDMIQEYRNNLDKIANIFNKNNIVSVICTLPRNVQVNDMSFDDKDMFTIWWISQKKTSKIDKILTLEAREKYWYYAAKAYDINNRKAEAERLYKKNIIVSEENMAADKLAKQNRKYIVLADIYAQIMKLCDNKPGYKYFIDAIHVYPPIYNIVTDEIIKSIYNWEKQENYKLFSNNNNWNWGEYHVSNVNEVFNEINRLLTVEFCADLLNRNIPWLGMHNCNNDRPYESYKNMFTEWIKINKKIIPGLQKYKNKIMKKVKENKDKEIIWGKYLAVTGEAFRETGYYKEALLYLNESIESDINNHLGYFYRGLWYYDRGNINLARKDFDRLKSIKPEFNWLTVEYLKSLE
jgi:tetratricopeptide (TPR) repeat protein